MTGKMRYCWLIGFIGFLITFASSSGNNLFMTSLTRGLIAFAVWVGLSYAVVWMLGFLKELPNDVVEQEEMPVSSEPEKGGKFDLTTPDESDELKDLLRQSPAPATQNSDFSPLNPPKLVKTESNDTEELVKVVRHLTQE